MLPKLMTMELADDLPSTRVTRCWDRSRLEEERIIRSDLAAHRDEFEERLTFGPLLLSDSNTTSEPLLANNYRQLVKYLRDADSPEAKLRLLAMWLRQEGILQPSEFLPKNIRKKLIKSTLSAFEKPKEQRLVPEHAEFTRADTRPKSPKRSRLSPRPSELLYALVAEAWIPYFELMHAEYERLPTDRQSGLEKRLAQLGFDTEAVRAAMGSTKVLRPATEAACRFAATHLAVGDDTVLVAHSKLHPKQRHRI